MAVTNQPWDGSASRWPDTPSYCDSCLINLNTGSRSTWTQDNCKLPIREPGGDINSNALGPATGALNGARGGLKDVPADAKKKAANALARAYRAAKMDIPDSLKRMM
ncbi:MAG TPA: hypothetical protein VKR06_46285 [Ktedonosporobacter sp.]|nr:hypothetical protein [Ktedonosporobacter sp.]